MDKETEMEIVELYAAALKKNIKGYQGVVELQEEVEELEERNWNLKSDDDDDKEDTKKKSKDDKKDNKKKSFEDDIDDDDEKGEVFKGLTEDEIDDAVREYSEEVDNKKIIKHWNTMKKATLTQKKHAKLGNPNLDLEYGCRFYFQFNAGGLKASMTMQFGCGTPRDTYSATAYYIKGSKFSKWKKATFSQFKKHKAF